MKSLADIAPLRSQVREWRNAGERVALVPTMGNVHAGHLSLVELAREHAERVVVSVFVNPAQFGPGEDLDAYPRTPAQDRAALRTAGADLMFNPTAATIYPFGLKGMTRVTVPELSAILCGTSRPGHFDGVTTVVCRLLNIVQPDLAVFGEKDYQQLLIVRRMVADLHLPVVIHAAPICREPDGLAMSSRNQYLGPADRARAPGLHAALQYAVLALRAGRRDLPRVEAETAARLMAAGLRPDYVAIRRAADLGAPRTGDRELVVLGAAQCGPARLIDNLRVAL